MAFVIRPYKGQREMIPQIAAALRKAFAKSRFCAGWSNEIHLSVGSKTIEFTGIRLRRAKTYCGNHPGPCIPNPYVQRKERRGVWLEGSDWAEFNDLVNDVLDELHVDARVASRSCVIRIHKMRRVYYDMHNIGRDRPHWDWDMHGEPGHYQPWCGKVAPRATVPMGTPGGIDAEREEARLARNEARRRKARKEKRAARAAERATALRLRARVRAPEEAVLEGSASAP